MNWKHLRAGERRKLARNLEENVAARRIGVVGMSLARMLTPVFVLLGLSAIAYSTLSFGEASSLFMMASVVGTRDFMKVLEDDGEIGPSLSERSRFVEGFDKSLDGFIRLIANRGPEGQKGWHSVHKREYLMKEAQSTSDFPLLFGTVLERQLLSAYKILAPDWRSYVKVGTQKDFRNTDLLGINGLQSHLAEVPQGGEYKAGKLDDGKVSLYLKKYGRQFPLTWEALINDDLGALSDVSTRLANAAMRTEFYEATKLFSSATGPNTSLYGATITHPVDGAAITNLGTAAFSTTQLELAIAAMREQVDIDGEPILISGFHLVVPPALEIAAMKVLNTAALIAVGVGSSAATTTSANVVSQMGITLHVNPYLPLVDAVRGDTAWYLFADLSSAPAVQMNFLRGHEAPELVQKASNKVALGGGLVSALEGDFESDTMAWRVRHVLGGTQLDPRATWASTGAS